MLSFKKSLVILLIGLLFSACSTKEFKKQESVFIVFKTPSFKHADQGFIYENSEMLKVEIYGSGQALVSFEITEENVCMSLLQCMPKKSFNKQVLSAFYPDDILEHILKGEKLFGGEDFTKTRNGFTQQIVKQDKYNIHYSVLNNHIIFRDTMNEILIKVKRIDR